MKFKIKTGRPFEGDITVSVTVRERRKGLSFKKVVVIALAATILGIALVSMGYGVVTGDYSLARFLAGVGKEMIVEVMAKIAKR